MKVIPNLKESFVDFPDGTPALVLYTCGCSIRCEGCHNKNLQSRATGVDMPVGNIARIFLNSQKVKHYALVIQGGEPTEQMGEVMELVREIKKHSPDTKICLYSGKEATEISTKVNGVDYLCCGPYIATLPTKGDGFKLASSNQTIHRKESWGWKLVSDAGVMF